MGDENKENDQHNITCLRGLWKITWDINIGAAICQL